MTRATRRPTIPDCGPLLERFDGKARPALARGHRGGIDPRCRLPPLAKLLAIDAAEEQAVAQAGASVGERNRGDATGETLGGCGPHTGTGGGADRVLGPTPGCSQR